MAKDSIQLSEKHGLNPSLEVCYVCGKDKGVILFGKLKGDVEAPRKACITKAPCDECKTWMTQGVICISIDPNKSTDKEDPWRSGGWAVVKDEAITKLLSHNEKLLASILEHRVMFMDDEVWDSIGFPPRKENDA